MDFEQYILDVIAENTEFVDISWLPVPLQPKLAHFLLQERIACQFVLNGVAFKVQKSTYNFYYDAGIWYHVYFGNTPHGKPVHTRKCWDFENTKDQRNDFNLFLFRAIINSLPKINYTGSQIVGFTDFESSVAYKDVSILTATVSLEYSTFKEYRIGDYSFLVLYHPFEKQWYYGQGSYKYRGECNGINN